MKQKFEPMSKLFLFINFLGISILGFAQNSPVVQISIQDPAPICAQGGCTLLTTEYFTPRATTDYTVSSIAFEPTFPFTGGISLNNNSDDIWSPAITLPFSFNFYGNSYNSILVGSNGVVTFDQSNQNANGYCNWPFTQTIPNLNFPIRNAIYGVYQDTNIASPPVTNAAFQNVNYYVANTAPNRVFVINFNELPQYQCNNSVGLQTSQIVMYETTNIIDIYVKSRTSCTTWNSGSGLIGIQNQTGTQAVTPPARNTGTWATNNEAWRIEPNGGFLGTAFTWYLNGSLLPNEFSNSLVACPSDISSYRVDLAILNSDTSVTIVPSNEVTPFIVPEPAFQNPQDFLYCTQAPFVYVADLSPNTNIILSGTLNPSDYIVTYYEDYMDAVNGMSNNITNINAYSFTENKTIYAAIQEDVMTGCRYVKSFQLILVPPTDPPTGSNLQNFISGQTLADLQVVGENITWYDAATAGNMLPPSTLLQDNTTYYATNTSNGCESRNANSNRLAVTVNLVLSAADFIDSSFNVYPNPASESISISSKNVIQSIQISNAIGQEVFAVTPNEKETKLMISQLSNGMYFLRLKTANGLKTIKIVKE